jgi:hypothetical protein
MAVNGIATARNRLAIMMQDRDSGRPTTSTISGKSRERSGP